MLSMSSSMAACDSRTISVVLPTSIRVRDVYCDKAPGSSHQPRASASAATPYWPTPRARSGGTLSFALRASRRRIFLPLKAAPRRPAANLGDQLHPFLQGDGQMLCRARRGRQLWHCLQGRLGLLPTPPPRHLRGTPVGDVNRQDATPSLAASPGHSPCNRPPERQATRPAGAAATRARRGGCASRGLTEGVLMQRSSPRSLSMRQTATRESGMASSTRSTRVGQGRAPERDAISQRPSTTARTSFMAGVLPRSLPGAAWPEACGRR